MLKKCLLLAFLSFQISLSAQVLSLVPHPLQNYQHPFNERFIERNAIKSIQVEISRKKEMDIIRSAHTFLVFDFNTEGKLISEKKFKMGDNDTLNFAFQYDREGKLLLEQEFIGEGILEKKYHYDADGNKFKIEYRKREPFAENSNLISIDSLKSMTIDGVDIQIYYNDYGRPYRETRVFYDSLGYLSKFRETFIISHKQNSIEYHYNDFGLLKEIDYVFALNDKTRKEVYEYNEEGVPETFLIYENDEQKKRQEFLYNPDGSLKAILFKEIESNLITIWQLSYLK